MKYLAFFGWWIGRVLKAFGIKNAKRGKLKPCHSQSNDKARFISFVRPVAPYVSYFSFTSCRCSILSFHTTGILKVIISLYGFFGPLQWCERRTDGHLAVSRLLDWQQ